MTLKDLKDTLQAHYKLENWQNILREVLGKPIFLTKDAYQPLFEDTDFVEKAFQFGSYDLPKNRKIAIVDIKLKDEKTPRIADTKVKLRELAAKLVGLTNSEGHQFIGVLALFHSTNQKNYRLAFIARAAEYNAEIDDFVNVETASKRFTYILGEGESCTTAAKQLVSLIEKAQVQAIELNDLKEAFNVDKLNKEFFKGYKEHYEKFWKYVNSQPNYREKLIDKEQTLQDKTEKPIRDFAKKLLGRIVFLYFLQKKGWMGSPLTSNGCRPEGGTEVWSNGDPNFIKNLFADFPDKAHFYSQLLTKLFFETLNLKREKDLFTPSGGKGAVRVPYLNGGLFDNDSVETNHFDFPESYFQDLFEFFDQFNFTIDENSPDDANVGIDPEMLGHIFENLLEENKDKGAFYTPKAIVQYMCQESLIQYLASAADPSDCPERGTDLEAIEKFIRHNDFDRSNLKGFIVKNARKIEELLDNVKICDPAIGSGAFPMGMLQEIFKAKMTLDLTLDPAEVKRHIIQNSIYGVDIDRGAVDIARLRFWLALVVDEDTPSPLPNLDYKIMQGNSLLESFEGIPLSNLQQTQTAITVFEKGSQIDMFGAITPVSTELLDTKRQDLDELIDTYFDTDSQHKAKIKSQINEIVHEHLHYNVDLKLAEIQTKIGDLEAEIGLITIYENDNKAKRDKKQKALETKQKALEKLQQEEERLQNALLTLDRIQETNERPYFLWHLFFKDVFTPSGGGGLGGFDIVIGNPPYFSVSKQPSLKILENEYETFESSGDIYSLFYEKGYNLLKTNGLLVYITSNKWLRAGYGKSLRRFFIEKTNPLQLVDFGQTLIFETAIVHSNILLFQKYSNQKQTLAVQFQEDLYKQNLEITSYIKTYGITASHFTEDIWTIADNSKLLIKTKAETKGKPLKDWNINFFRGVLTGLNEAFIIERDVYQKLIDADSKNQEILKPILRGRDTRKYHCNFGNLWLINTHNGYKEIPRVQVEKEYPTVFEYLKQFETDAIRRFDKGNHWTNLRNCAYLDEFEKPKIVFSEIVSEPQFYYDEQGYYPEATVFFISGEKLKYLTALLNSNAATYIFKNFYAGGELVGKYRYKKAFLENLPIPYPTPEEEVQIETLVNQILTDKKAGNDTIALEAEIDRLVYELYGLTEGEIANVEGRG